MFLIRGLAIIASMAMAVFSLIVFIATMIYAFVETPIFATILLAVEVWCGYRIYAWVQQIRKMRAGLRAQAATTHLRRAQTPELPSALD